MQRLLALAMLTTIASPVLAQSARDEGRALGEAAARDAQGLADNDAAAVAHLDGYDGANAPQSTYIDNAGALEGAATSASRTNDASLLVIDGDRTRPRVPAAQVDETVARGNLINETPDVYARGVEPSGTTSTCVPLPPSTNSPGTFEATCNSGSKVVQEMRTCHPAIVTRSVTTTVYDYWVNQEAGGAGPMRGILWAALVDPHVASGLCKAQPETIHVCDAMLAHGAGGSDPAGWVRFCKRSTNAVARRHTCSATIPGIDGYRTHSTTPIFLATATGQIHYAMSSDTVVTCARDNSACTPLESDAQCSFQGIEVCTDATPETRVIDGQSITQSCWAWQRDYQCDTITTGNDCTDLDNNAACRFDRVECLDDPRDGACKVEERIYTCPIPGNAPGEPQMVCGGDVYCIGGECEAVTREASNEFKDAVVGLESLAQVNREFDEMDFKLFKGTAMSCHKPVFGLVNCCAGKSSGLIPAATGFAALAGGPTAIAGLATPFLTMFLCKPSEMELDVRDRMGLCHTLGWYCSGSFLGVCHSKRRSSCCFLSKLTRILQEQGRAQLNKSWGNAKTPDCAGFTIEEFARLDLSQIDFAEVYQEFVEAAKLPDQAATMADIQAKIVDFYSRGRP